MEEHPSHLEGNPFRREVLRLRREFREASLYESFQQIIVLVLTILIMVITSVAAVTLVIDVLDLLWENQINLVTGTAIQKVFAGIFTVIIALEFKNSLRASFEERTEVVRGRTIILIALLAVVRKFIILDLQKILPVQLLALAAASLALGVVYWSIREQDVRILAKKAVIEPNAH